MIRCFIIFKCLYLLKKILFRYVYTSISVIINRYESMKHTSCNLFMTTEIYTKKCPSLAKSIYCRCWFWSDGPMDNTQLGLDFIDCIKSLATDIRWHLLLNVWWRPHLLKEYWFLNTRLLLVRAKVGHCESQVFCFPLPPFEPHFISEKCGLQG